MRWRAALVVTALGAALLPLPARGVERLYSMRVYLTIQPLLTAASNRTSIALLDLLVVGGGVLWIGLAVSDIAGSASVLRAALRIIVRTILWCAALYLLFLATWGLNYRRLRLIDKLPFDAAAVTTDAARDAGGLAVDRLNALHHQAHAGGWGGREGASGVDAGLADAFARAAGDLDIPSSIVVARPKRTMLDWYFRRAGVDGMTDPFFLETLVASGVLPFERPFLIAHEWSHLAGIADEGEANFAGWLTCRRGSAADQYSGWLFLYQELARAVGARDRAALAAALASGPRADLEAIRDRFARQVSPRVSAAGWHLYDSYLKANRVEAGAASYAEVVRLVLGVRLADGRRPVADP
jgi:hypothetical protein